MNGDMMENNQFLPEASQRNLTFSRFIKAFFKTYKNFLKTYAPADKAPFLYILIWLMGMANVIEKFELKSVLKGRYLVEDWFTLWIIILAFGVINGLLSYWIGGAIYHLRVLLSGGRRDFRASRRIFVYARLPMFFITILLTIVETAVYGNKYFTESTHDLLDLMIICLSTLAIIYALVLSYKGVRFVQNTKRLRSIFFFILLPAAFYLFMLFLIGYGAYAHYAEGLEDNETAVILMNSGNLEDAERLFNQALKNMTKDDVETKTTIYENLALLCEYKGESNTSIYYYRKALALTKPGQARHHALKGNISLLRGSLDLAIQHYEKALDINPDELDASNNLGLIYMGEVDEDVWDLEKALVYNKQAHRILDDMNMANNLALNYYLLEKHDEALPLYQSIILNDPGDANAFYYMGLIYFEKNDLTKAKKHLQEAIELDPFYDTEEAREILGN